MRGDTAVAALLLLALYVAWKRQQVVRSKLPNIFLPDDE